ncbi:plasmid mobilization relaxosome protein MobC [Mucilaginibacter sp. dw_454]|uniref:plasmid mobilization relaxosome protein MobC n=1 Tax=Mucilaginibacter sp. dw_454 TaxID=2720079 RepID=UPI001BD637D9|nr:plasmid mobilization relaxosome protein MobC [Mucilaginibacter sp. dw_454]
MGRKQAPNADENLTEIIMLRVSKATFDRLENIRSNSDCRTIPEVVRRIIDKDKIIFFHKDATMDAPMEILIGLQKELRAIGININQITRNFNSMAGERQRWYQIKRAAQYYNQVDTKVSLLLSLISQLAKKWLQK